MKYLILIVFIFSACNKTTPSSTSILPYLTTNQIVDKAVGNFKCNRVCKTGSNVNGYVYDTTTNVNLTITKVNDSTIRIDSFTLFYDRYDTSVAHHFQYPNSGGGHHFTIDTSFKNIYFSFWNGGLRGGTGCNYDGIKQ